MVQSRARWINIGKALAEGRMLLPGKVNDRKYGEWIKACGFDNIEVSTRSDAIWFVGMSRVTLDIPSDMNHPKNIRQWNRDQQVAKPPSPDLDISAPADVALVLLSHGDTTRGSSWNGSKTRVASLSGFPTTG